jgi:hypothetical protein
VSALPAAHVIIKRNIDSLFSDFWLSPRICD